MRARPSASGAMKRAPAGPFATAPNPGQPWPPPHSAAARPSSTIAGPSPARSRYTAWKSRAWSRPSPSSTYLARMTSPEPRTPNIPGVEYIAATIVRFAGDRPIPLNASWATSPWTSAMSSRPASSIGTFSVLPLVFRCSIASVGSVSFTVSATAAPYTGKPPPGVAVPRTTTVVDMADTLSRPALYSRARRKIDDALRRCRRPAARRARVERARATGPDHDLAARRGHDDGSGPEHSGPDGELLLQSLRHAHSLGRSTPSRAGSRDLVEERQRHDLGVHAPPGSPVPRRRALHRGRRQGDA